MFSLQSASRWRCGSVGTVRHPGLPCQMKPTRDCGDASHNAQGLVCYPQLVDRLYTGPRGRMLDRFRPRRTAADPVLHLCASCGTKAPRPHLPGVHMKTLTEFSGTMIRMAAKAAVEARKSLPPELTRVAPPAAVSGGVTAKPNENASAVPTDAGADSATGAAALGLAEQAAGQSDAVVGTTSEPHIEKPGEAGTAEDMMQPGAAAVEAEEEAAAEPDLAGPGAAE